MSKARDGLQIVAAPAVGWCDPHSGVCHVDTADETASAEATSEDPVPDVPDVSEARDR